MPYKDKEIKKLYYSIGEVADKFDVATSLIRFWEQEFEFIKPKKNKKGNRIYTEEDIENIRIVYYLVKEKGYTLAGARETLKTNKQDTKDRIETLNSLRQVKSFLEDLRKEL